MKKWILSLKVLVLTLAMALAPSCGNQPTGLPNIPGVQGPLFNVVDGKVMITFNFLTLNSNFGGRIPLPKTKNSFVEITPNIIDGGTTAQFLLDVEDLRSAGLGSQDPTTLPDGRPLPGIPGGTLPAIAVNVHEILDSTLYFNSNLFGLFIPINKLNTQGLSAYYKVVIKGQDAGLLGIVSSDENGENAGFTLFLKLDTLRNKDFKKIINLSKKNRSVVY
ncbi:MAG: hypothetical protein ACOVP4_08615 [Bacteriovoracaceae bacterium]